ncbi:HAD hydrolase-like protein [Candidatus Woesearchaeota archaeon]|nr:HAD hydrolase-like protein [Candidatus Woesearchaeota archaeon]
MNFHTVLLDGDGVLYCGTERIDGVKETLQTLMQRGITTVLLTNNAVKIPQHYATWLNNLYFDKQDVFQADHVVTPLDVVVPFFTQHADDDRPKKVMVWGGTGELEERIEQAGFSISDDPKEVGWVVVSELVLDKDRTEKKRDAAFNAVQMYRAAIVGTNSDIYDMHTDEEGKRYKAVTGSYVGWLRMGKANPPMFWLGKEAKGIYQVVFDRFNITPDDGVLGVGDRIETDIYGANNVGIQSVLLDSRCGVDHADDIGRYIVRAQDRAKFLGKPSEFAENRVAEMAKYRPKKVISNIREILG